MYQKAAIWRISLKKIKLLYNDSTGNPITMFGQGVTVWRKDSTGSWKNVVESIPPLPPYNK